MDMIRVQFVPKYNVVRAYLRRNDLQIGGEFNGYVELHKDHPLSGKDYEIVDNVIYDMGLNLPHGGTTFAEPSGDEFYLLGFDTFHPGDNRETWNDETTKDELIKYVNTLKEVGRRVSNMRYTLFDADTLLLNKTLRILRIYKGVSLKELAEYAGVSFSMLSMAETAKRPVSIDLIYVYLDYLFNGTVSITDFFVLMEHINPGIDSDYKELPHELNIIKELLYVRNN